MIYYYTYRILGGRWQTTAITESKRKAEEKIKLYSHWGKGIIAESERELEEKKEEIKLAEEEKIKKKGG